MQPEQSQPIAPSTEPQVQPQTPPSAPQKSKLTIVITAVIALLVIIAAIVFIFLKPGTAPSQGTQDTGKTEALLYDTLQNASKQPLFRVGMYRGLYANEADVNSGTLAAEWSTVSELDTTKSDYRNVYAYRLPGSGKFNLGRCLTGRDMRPFLTPNADMPTTLQGAIALLDSKKLQTSTERLTQAPCPLLGTITTGTVDLAPARMSDGVFPVGLSEAESAKWIASVKVQKPFDVKDEGTVTKDGRMLRKISFTPKSGDTQVNKKLYEAFKDMAGELKKETAYSFISISYANEGGVKGYYLIDEAAKLPVYSELSNTDVAQSESTVLKAFNVIHTKQNYTYGSPLKLDDASPLDFVKP